MGHMWDIYIWGMQDEMSDKSDLSDKSDKIMRKAKYE